MSNKLDRPQILKQMKLSIGSDHAGYQYKELISNMLKEKGILVVDKGTHTEESVDYPDYAHEVARSVESKETEFGILICGSGIGVSISANKHTGIRAALCWKVELAELSRRHNNANILCLPARFISEELAIKIVTAFLNTQFEGGRHEKRVNKIEVI